MATSSFFEEPRQASLVKSDIVANYFMPWAKIMAGQAEQIGYLDLYAGPGPYKDGTKTTAIRIVERALGDAQIAGRLVTLFNDADGAAKSSLEVELRAVPGIEALRYQPDVRRTDVSGELVSEIEDLQSLIPSLSFIDPFGYKGLTLRLIRSVVKDWGCEVIFFFNYNRINAAIFNAKVQNHMSALFGEQRLERLRDEVKSAALADRPDVILRHLSKD